jgi:adenylate cyclase
MTTFDQLHAGQRKIRQYLIAGMVFGAGYGCIEYLAKSGTDDAQIFIPLLIRTTAAGTVIIGSAAILEILSQSWFVKRPFGFVVLIRSFAYVLIITFWLLVANGIWYMFNGEGPFQQQLIWYLQDPMYAINLFSVLFVVILVVGLGQINSLHRKGELLNFILGKYHSPKEVDRIFCFVDLKNSTTIAEKLGHVRFAMFLKDYYSDISEALRKTHAGIYQYIGDEIVLSWSFEEGLRDNRCVFCFFEMKKLISGLKDVYQMKYGVFPEFRAGLHGGRVTVTWVGELKKEIVYIGDVLNTTARIREDCKRLGKDVLISEDLLHQIKSLGRMKATFIEETVPRGKAKSVKIYSLEEI